MFNHAGPPQIRAFPGIGPSNDRGDDAKACNHVRGSNGCEPPGIDSKED